MAIYVRRYGSIALSGSGPITLSNVFDNMQLSNRQCNPTQIASGNCNTLGGDPIRIVLAKALKSVDPFLKDNEGSPIIQLIDVNSPERQKKTYDICKGIRTVSRLNLHLSTLDETMIRWAFTKEGGLQDALNDPVKASRSPLRRAKRSPNYLACAGTLAMSRRSGVLLQRLIDQLSHTIIKF